MVAMMEKTKDMENTNCRKMSKQSTESDDFRQPNDNDMPIAHPHSHRLLRWLRFSNNGNFYVNTFIIFAL